MQHKSTAPLSTAVTTPSPDALVVGEIPTLLATRPEVAATEAIVLRNAPVYTALKRVGDPIFALVALVLLSPLFALLALVVKLGDGGSVIYRREVIGLNGKPFYAFKFRTMIPQADEYLAARGDLLVEYATQVKLRNDPRTTRVGRILRRTSLDELPQLVNVLLGEMSLVGPRFIHASEVERFGDFARVRQRVRPGITGLWQVSGRQTVSYARRVELDKEYMRRRGIALDLFILFKTVVAVARMQGAY